MALKFGLLQTPQKGQLFLQFSYKLILEKNFRPKKFRIDTLKIFVKKIFRVGPPGDPKRPFSRFFSHFRQFKFEMA